MKIKSLIACAASSGLSMALAGCGGGGGSGVASTPPAPLTPTPTPTPAPPPPIPAGAIGLQSAAPFKTVSAYTPNTGALVSGADNLQFSYSAANDRYTISLPDGKSGTLTTTGGEGSYNPGVWLNLTATSNDVTTPSGAAIPKLNVLLDWPASSALKYTSHGRWYDNSASPTSRGVFAYGIPTGAGDVPLSGSATYAGSIYGITASTRDNVFGSVSLTFNFGAGTLSGVMKPEIAPVWDAIPLGDYVFRDTVYSAGSTSFSGAFQVNGSTASSYFEGSFTGPQAAELLASWGAPYLNPISHQWDMMAGVWTAKKP